MRDIAFWSLASSITAIVWTSSLAAQPLASRTSAPSRTSLDGVATVRLALKPNAQVEKNIVELNDVADLSGSEAFIQAIRHMPLGPAPAAGGRLTWSQEEVLRLLQLRGIDSKAIRWGGDEVCQVIRREPSPVVQKVEYTPSPPAPQAIAIAERTLADVISNYLKSKSSDAATWTIKANPPNEHLKLLAQKKSIKGIAGGLEPWTGAQQFHLLVQTPQGEQSIDVTAMVQVPSMVCGATGPLAKGRILEERDLKPVRLTSAMKASEEDCFSDAGDLIGKELRRSISTGQPILHADTGPPRTIHARDIVEIHVIAGAIVAQTSGRALQSGGMDEVIEVEVEGTKKRLAARIVRGNRVEAIAR